ncbi:unnamed protein product [Penicillium salamii]|uniref:Uncharacterized protein n=1 Tax=Penicillium salamii TaxID=1612424 RepID=A0A9W4JPC9_9EURO|nr:unnamed protein product [Penicillium salamii]CAG8013600.1 unnamed protein product [Penicillium salamii]CAG8017160.1 unnamed protein product [Penicillium salamii]CAG8059452.1 unnamed protein product [Penicillium salamii]CAG8185269.1 unnamed protein product [Penicillium salamii]
MTLPKSLKTEPLGSFDTRLTMKYFGGTEFSPNRFAPVVGLDGAAEEQPDTMQMGASPKREYRTLELREPFGGFNLGQNLPRLELDAAVDKCHSLDGLTGPSNPQNTPASNSVRDCTPEPLQHDTKNLQTSHASRGSNADFGCFLDSPEKSLFARRDGDTGPLKPSKLRRLLVSQRQWLESPVSGLGGHRPLASRSAIRKPGKPGVVRYVRFRAAPSLLSSPPHVPSHPLPSIERQQDYIATYRKKKQCEKWKLAHRPTPRKPSSTRISAAKARVLGNFTPRQADGFDRSLSSSPLHRLDQMPFPAQSYGGTHALDGTVESASNTPVVRSPKVARSSQSHPVPLLLRSRSLLRSVWSVIQSTPALQHFFELTASPIKEDLRQVKPRTILKIQILLVSVFIFIVYIAELGLDTQARGLVILISLGLNVELIL